MRRDIKPIYVAVNAVAGRAALDQLSRGHLPGAAAGANTCAARRERRPSGDGQAATISSRTRIDMILW